MGAGVLKAISVFFLGATKLLWAPGTAAAYGMNFWESVILTGTGGIVGVCFFFYFGHLVFLSFDNWRAKRRKKPIQKKVFTKKNRMVVILKSKFGLIGLAVLTPCILSIPVGCVIAAKFYYSNRLTLPLLITFTIVWSFLLSLFVYYLKALLFA